MNSRQVSDSGKCWKILKYDKMFLLKGTDGFGFPMMLDMYALLLSKQEREKGRNGFDAEYVCSTTVKTRERKR